MIFKGLALLKLKYAGYRETNLDMYWYTANALARKNMRKIRVLEKSPGDAWIIYNSKPSRVHTINHDNLHDMDPNAVMGYIRNLADAIVRAADEK